MGFRAGFWAIRQILGNFARLWRRNSVQFRSGVFPRASGAGFPSFLSKKRPKMHLRPPWFGGRTPFKKLRIPFNSVQFRSGPIPFKKHFKTPNSVEFRSFPLFLAAAGVFGPSRPHGPTIVPRTSCIAVRSVPARKSGSSGALAAGLA